MQQGFYVANKDEGSCGSNVGCKLVDFVECCKLRVDEFRLEGAHGGQREVVVGQQGDARATLFVLDFYFLADDVVVFGSVLLFDAYFLNALYILDG